MPLQLLCEASEAIERAQSAEDLLVEIRKFARELGFENFVYALTVTAPALKPQQFVLSGYPAEWRERYRHRSYFKIDPIVQHAYKTNVPCLWENGDLCSDGKANEFWEEAGAVGLKSGVSFSVHGRPGLVGIFSLSRDRVVDLTGDGLAALIGRAQMFSSLLHEAVCRLQLATLIPEGVAALTTREQECLRWAAEGKTAWEIGQILSITERTAVFHLNNVVQKLNATNKTQAIVKAISLKLL